MLGWQLLGWGAGGRPLGGWRQRRPGLGGWGGLPGQHEEGPRGPGARVLFVEGPRKEGGEAGHPRSWVQEATGRLGPESRESCFELDSWLGSCGQAVGPGLVGGVGDVTGGAVRGMAKKPRFGQQAQWVGQSQVSPGLLSGGAPAHSLSVLVCEMGTTAVCLLDWWTMW